MTDVTVGYICSGPGFLFRRVMHCIVCDQRRRFIVRDDVWYGALKTCCACGTTWNDGFRDRQSVRQKEKAAAKAKGQWVEAPPRAEVMKALIDYVDMDAEG